MVEVVSVCRSGDRTTLTTVATTHTYHCGHCGSVAVLPGVISSASFRPGELRRAAQSLELEAEVQRQQYEQVSLALELLLEQKRALGFDEDADRESSDEDESAITPTAPTPARSTPDRHMRSDPNNKPTAEIVGHPQEDFTPALLGSRIARRSESRSTTESGSGASSLTPRARLGARPEHQENDPPPPMPADSWCPAISSQAVMEETEGDELKESCSVVEWTPSQLGNVTADEPLTLNSCSERQDKRQTTTQLPVAAATVADSTVFESLTASVIGGLGLVPHEAAVPTEQKAVRAPRSPTRVVHPLHGSRSTSHRINIRQCVDDWSLSVCDSCPCCFVCSEGGQGQWAHAIAQQRAAVSMRKSSVSRRSGGGLAAVLARTQADDARRKAAALRYR